MKLLRKLFSFFALFTLSLFVFTAATSSPAQSLSAACQSTRYPSVCQSMLSSNPPSGPYGYGKLSVKRCLRSARNISHVVKQYVHQQGASVGGRESGALNDCQRLFQLNIGFLKTVRQDLRSAAQGSPSSELVAEIRSRMSAVVTNQETCLDGLSEAERNVTQRPETAALTAEMSRVSQMYSVALGLVTDALGQDSTQQSHGGGSTGGGATPSRTPLATFIEGLRTGTSDYTSNNNLTCAKRYRISSEIQGKGVLVKESIIVSKDGTGKFTTIREAVDYAPSNLKAEDGYFVIYVKEGVYEEYITIPSYKTNIMLIGDGINSTVITGDRNVVDGSTTFNSSTFAIDGDRFMGVGVTFRNTAGPEKGQAVALRNGAHNSALYRCSFEGYQDTLYVHTFQQFYRECQILGTVDFIFGHANAVFQGCTILARRPMQGQPTVVTAQGRDDAQHFSGISIQNCTIDAAPDLLAADFSAPTYLGRPWKLYATTVVMQSYLGAAVAPAGWLQFQGQDGLDTLYYGEYENYGPGADTSKRVRWPGYKVLSSTEALNFTVYNMTQSDAWLPDTDIPFTAGLY